MQTTDSETTESPEPINDWKILDGGSFFGIILFMLALTLVVILMLVGREHKKEKEKKRATPENKEIEIPMNDP